MQLQTELDALRAKGRPELTADNLARIIELWTKIPAASIRADEFEQLAGLGDRLRAHIVGQDAAIDTVCAAIRRNRVGLQAKRKPASFLFVGGTGVGKTELVKRLADELFHAPESLIRLDMSEFMEKFSVSRMIGSPPGYVGYDEAGQLTEKIRRRPYSVVLFDEIEKAHPDVMNLLLQILDDGRITDAQGRTVNFENTVIIMTTNAGSNTHTGALGFGLSTDDQSRERARPQRVPASGVSQPHRRDRLLQPPHGGKLPRYRCPHARRGAHRHGRARHDPCTGRPPSSTTSSARATARPTARATCAAPSSATWRTPSPRPSSPSARPPGTSASTRRTITSPSPSTVRR